MKFRLRGRLLIPTLVLVAALLQSDPLCGQTSPAPSSTADDAAKRLQWLKSRSATAPAAPTASATPAPTPAASTPAPPKRFAVSRTSDLRPIDPPAAASPAPKPSTTPATVSATPRVVTEPPAKKSTASSKPSETPSATPKSKKTIAEKSPGATPAPSATASTSTSKTASKTAATDPATPAPAADSTPAPSRTAKGKASSPTPTPSRTAKASPESTPTPEATPKKSLADTKPAETPPAKSKKTTPEKSLTVTATPTPTPSSAPKSTPAPKLADTTASNSAARDLLSIPAQTAKLSLPARTTSITPLATPDPYRLPPVPRSVGGRFPWKTNIVTTVFWIGERPTANNPTPNHASSWDMNWARSYGGFDNPDPDARRNFIPTAFTPRLNPFYVALPYNDVTRGTTKPESRLVIPWFKSAFEREGKSVCRDRWVAVRSRSGKVAYGQWSDCGPFRTDHWQYVFGNERPRPNLNNGAGLDVSPAMRDYLGISSTDVTDWKFVDDRDVPPGPWARYGENNTFAQRARR